jgi:hypothetical protein
MNAAPQNDNALREQGEVGTANNYESDFTYPQRRTQPARLLAMLLHSERIDPLRGWLELGIYRLSDTAFQLRGLGWPVETSSMPVKNRFNESCCVGQYSLPLETIEEAASKGAEFAAQEYRLMSSSPGSGMLHPGHSIGTPATNERLTPDPLDADALNLRRHSTGGAFASYEAAKSAWDAANPGADYRTRDAAMRKLAGALGV